jgi:glycosyltransferase involved in cell wall biosynthesis
VFDAEDPRGLAEAIRRLAEDPRARTALAEAARRRALRRYGYDRWSGEVIAVLRAAARRTAVLELALSARSCSSA